MRQRKAKKVLKTVVSTFNEIGEEFDRTRQIPVKEFEHFKPYIKPEANIIDLGCGNGRLIKSLPPETKTHYLGIDNSEKMLEIARKNHPGQTFAKGDLLDIPANNASTDVIFCIRTFHHLPSKKLRAQALREMNRVLEPNGFLVITVWNLLQKRFWKFFAAAILRFIFTLGGYAWNDLFIPWSGGAKRYYHAFSPMELNNLVTNSGFEIEELFAVKDGNRVPLKESHDIVIIARKNNNV